MAPDSNAPLFDSKAAGNARDAGRAHAISKGDRYTTVQMVRATAKDLISQGGKPITIDDVVEMYAAKGISLPDRLGNAMGCIFSDPRFVWTGKVEPSRRVSRHRNLVRVWDLKGRTA
jgi:hypothetical protein